MNLSFSDRLKSAWNVFKNGKEHSYKNAGVAYSYRPDRRMRPLGNERSIVTSVYNRIAIDAASIDVKHIRVDKDGRYLEDINSCLNSCFNIEANIDQTGRAFFQDLYMSMFDEGCVAIVPTDLSVNNITMGVNDIYEMRVAQILAWYPEHIRVRVYNEKTGCKEELVIKKSMAAIIENPLYSIMNEPNSTMQRLIRKLSILDVIDEQSGAGKLDLIIQLPYLIRSSGRREQAEERRSEIEKQLTGSKYGIAYTDGTERIIQLNRPINNNLMSQIEYLTSMLYSQLGITKEILDGTAKEQDMSNYYTRSIDPIVSSVVDEMKRKFLSKTARSQGQSISYFRDPFKLVPLSMIADIADKFTRNEILSSNEVRQIIGFKPSNEPNADKLQNKNLKGSESQNGPEPYVDNKNKKEEIADGEV